MIFFGRIKNNCPEIAFLKIGTHKALFFVIYRIYLLDLLRCWKSSKMFVLKKR